MTGSSLSHRDAGQAAALLVLAALCIGCSSRAAGVEGPDVDPDDLSQELMSDYDKDSSGSLSKEELSAIPAVVDRLGSYDKDKNGEVSADEMSAHLADVYDTRLAVVAATCRVTRNGKPLKGAIVYFVPIKQLEGKIKVAGAVTISNGTGQLSIPIDDLPANAPKREGFVQPGLYTVEVTHPQLPIPEQYNNQTTLGREVSSETMVAGVIEIPLDF